MIICVDYGTRYIGVATTDYDEKIPLRHSVLDAKQQDVLKALTALVAHEKARLVLVGVPVSLSGNVSQQTKITELFIEQLRTVLPADVEIKTVDETLTSYEAAAHIKMEGGKKEDEHAEAARLMLATYLGA